MSFLKSIAKAIVVTIVVSFTIIFLIALAAPSAEEVQQGVDDIHNQVALDAEQQYAAVAEHGTAVDRCVRAGLVAESYLQGNNDAEYAEWKQIEKEDCNAAGIIK